MVPSVSHSMGLAAPGNIERQLSTRLCLGGSMLNRIHSLISSFTHPSHAFLGFHRPLVLSIPKFETDLVPDVTCRTCSDLLRSWLWTTAPTSLMSANHGVVIVMELLQVRRVSSPCLASVVHSSAVTGRLHFAIPLGDRLLVVRMGKSFVKFPQATHHIVAIALSRPPPALSMSLRLQKVASTTNMNSRLMSFHCHG